MNQQIMGLRQADSTNQKIKNYIKIIQMMKQEKHIYVNQIQDYKLQIQSYIKQNQKLRQQQQKYRKLLSTMQQNIRIQKQQKQKQQYKQQKQQKQYMKLGEYLELVIQNKKDKQKIIDLMQQLERIKMQRQLQKQPNLNTNTSDSKESPKSKKKSSTQSKKMPTEQPIHTLKQQNQQNTGLDIERQQQSIVNSSIRSYISQFNNKVEIRSVIYDLKKPSQGIILFKQQYQKLFYEHDSYFPSLQSIKILFDTSNQNKNSDSIIQEQHAIIKFIINGNPNTIADQQNQQSSSIGVQVKPLLWFENQEMTSGQKDQLKLPYKLIPCENQNQKQQNHKNSTHLAKELLHKKFWIKVSSALNEARLTIGDLVDITNLSPQKNQYVKVNLGMELMNTWSNQSLNFKLHNNIQNKNIYDVCKLTRFQIIFTFKQKVPRNQKYYNELIKDHFHIKIFGLCKLLSPILVKNPSPLTNHANLHILPEQIRVLYEYLQNISITDLPKFDNHDDQKINQNDYYSWKSLRQAIHSSIITKPGCFEIQKQGQKIYIPIGILNVLMRAKSINLKNPELSKIFEFKMLELDTDQIEIGEFLSRIYETRKMYIRFQMINNEGLGPGGMAVLQVWPPYCCSSVHDHGSAYGIVKVLSNQLVVQNFKDINFIPDDQQPYLQSVYQQNQYTWLSQFAYGVHRLINLTSQTTLTLQTYNGDQGSREFFSFVQNKGELAQYCEYYPQHDWENFLNFSDFFKDSYIPKETHEIFTKIRTIIKYISLVKNFYKIDEKKCGFQTFVSVLKKQYETLFNLKKQSNISKQLKIKWIPLYDLPIQ